MSLSKINPTKTKTWKALLKKNLELDGVKIIDLFDSSNNRLDKFSINFDIRLPIFFFFLITSKLTSLSSGIGNG